MSKHLDTFVDDGNVYVTLGIPIPEMTMLKETLALSRQRIKDPIKFIESKSLAGALSLASSTVEVSAWKHLEALASKLGVESPV